MSPGFCDTALDHMDAERKAAMLANTAASLPAARAGEPADMGAAIRDLASAPFVTGVVPTSTVGTVSRQYADAATDPMAWGRLIYCFRYGARTVGGPRAASSDSG